MLDFLVLQPHDKAAMLGSKQYNFSQRIYMKIEFSSQRREMILFLTTNMATVTSRIQTSYISMQQSSYEMWNYKNA